MIDDEVEYLDGGCPKCGAHALRRRPCTSLHCDDGFEDEADDDPINFAPGEEVNPCRECHGAGVLIWCSSCGAELRREDLATDDDAAPDEPQTVDCPHCAGLGILDDRNCRHCEGSGSLLLLGDEDDEDDEGKIYCPVCGGYGGESNGSDFGTCEECGGSGWVYRPTDSEEEE